MSKSNESEGGWHKVQSSSQKKANKPRPIISEHIEEEIGGYDHQDWKPRILNSGSVPKSKEQLLDPPKKRISVDRTAQKIEQKAEEGDLHIEHPTIEMAQAIQNARTSKGWKQADLAKHCNLPLNVIQSYENRTATVNGQTVGILSRVLGIKLADKREKRS